MARWSKTRVGAGVAVGAVLAGCLVAARVIISGADRDAAHVAAVSTSSPAGSSSAAPNNDRGARQATSSAEVMSVDGIDVDRVAKRTGAFQSMLDSLRYYAGRNVGEDIGITANRVDIESFVKGKSDEDLLLFARQSQRTSPYAAMQVSAYLMDESHSPMLRISAADIFVSLLPSFGDELDRKRSVQFSDVLKDMYTNETFMSGVPLDDRVEMIRVMQSHHSLLGLDHSGHRTRAEIIRHVARTDLELSIADFYEAAFYFNRGHVKDALLIRDLYERISHRGAFNYMVLKDEVESLLREPVETLEQLVLAGGEFHRWRVQATDERWQEVLPLPPEERVNRVRSLR